MASGCGWSFYKKKTKELKHSRTDDLVTEKAAALVSKYDDMSWSDLTRMQSDFVSKSNKS